MKKNNLKINICALLIISVYISIYRFQYSQNEDMGIFLSIAGFVSKGMKLYVDIFEFKDPLFIFSSAILIKYFGPKAPFILDLILIPAGVILSYLVAIKMEFSRVAAFFASIIFLMALTGDFYQTFRSTLFAIDLILFALYLCLSHKFFYCGIVCALVGGFKLPYLLLLGSLLPLIWNGFRGNIIRVMFGFFACYGLIFIFLAIRGELIAYFYSVVDNILYANNYLALIGSKPGIAGHLDAFKNHGINISYLLAGFIGALIFGLQNIQKISFRAISQLLILQLLCLCFLVLTAMWMHHFHILSLYVWSASLLILGGLVGSLSYQKYSKSILVIFVSILIATTSAYFLAINTGLLGSLYERGSIQKILHHKWIVPNEVTHLEEAYRQFGKHKTFARIGVNNDNGFGAFISPDWLLSCARIQQGGSESNVVLQEFVDCVERKPNYVIISPDFYRIMLNDKNFNQFRALLIATLQSRYQCRLPLDGKINDWNVCVRK